MRTVTSPRVMASAAARLKATGRTVGLVPTMGYLHEGHLSLVRASKRSCDITVASIFVNPAQFGPNEDLKDYPRDAARDARLLRAEGADFLFRPQLEDMYPPGYKTYVQVLDLQDGLCGLSRPVHFRGVCTVVLKLFNIVRPDRAFFGQKDFQQAVIIRRMARDLDLDVRVDVRPIVRERDGLALSSRNIYLSPPERHAALVLSRSLEEARRTLEGGQRRVAALLARLRARIGAEPLARLDYAAVVDPDDLRPLTRVEDRALIALAVFIGRTRLIDNILYAPKRGRIKARMLKPR